MVEEIITILQKKKHGRKKKLVVRNWNRIKPFKHGCDGMQDLLNIVSRLAMA